VTLRLIEGLAKAKEVAGRRRGLELEAIHVPPAAAERTKRLFGEALSPHEVVRRILGDVRERGDAAVRHYTEMLDGVDLTEFEVSREAVQQALESVPPTVRDALEQANARVRSFQQKAMPRPWVDLETGLGEMVVPIERVGVYVPGGTAVLPSTVLMTATPARVAGVKEIILVSPPFQGKLHPLVLAAAAIAGVDRVFQVGGVQAIGALAYGTQSIPYVE
jgi:histidinol dehydrogenase